MFSFLLENNLVSSNQSGLKPGDSCINQLLSITHEVFQSFDEGFEVRSIFLDISKAFVKIWHKGLIFKLSQNGISGSLLNILSDFLSDRKQRVVLNGQKSTWENVNAGVPQCSILGPLLFLIYINDLSGDLSSKTKLFADDTSLFNVAHDINTSANELNNDLKKVSNWAFQWKMSFNFDYGDVLFDQAFNASFHEKLESIQYNACLALTRTIRGTSKEKLYQELGLESLQLHRWYRKLCLFL